MFKSLLICGIVGTSIAKEVEDVVEEKELERCYTKSDGSTYCTEITNSDAENAANAGAAIAGGIIAGAIVSGVIFGGFGPDSTTQIEKASPD